MALPGWPPGAIKVKDRARQIVGRTQTRLDEALAQLGPNACAVCGSITDTADLDRLFDAVKAERGNLDILLANVGISELAPLGQITPDQYDRIFGTNVKGLLFTVQMALPLMSAGGSIILTGSIAGSMGIPQFSLYSASKATIRSFARTWAQDLKGTGIRVNVLSPGATRTEKALEIMGEEGLDAVGAGMPLGRAGDEWSGFYRRLPTRNSEEPSLRTSIHEYAVHVNGLAVRPCSRTLASVAGTEVLTIEGLGNGAQHPLQKHWIKAQVPQCGYCQPGSIMQAASLLNKHPDPTDEEIVKTMNTVLCRCMTCDRIKVAIRGAARQYLRDDNHPCVHS